jgi:hypothetical protein
MIGEKMKIQIIEHVKPTKSIVNHSIEIRMEQEENGYENGINKIIEFSSSESQGLSEDELYTLAFKRVSPMAIKRFKEVGYVEETFNPVGFKIIESKASRINIVGVETAKKAIGEDLYLDYSALLLDQYGDVMKQLPIYNNEIELIGHRLKINENKSQMITLSAKDGDLMQSKEVVIEYVEKELTETEQLASMVTTLALDSAEKQQQIELLVNQVTNLMLESGGNQYD